MALGNSGRSPAVAGENVKTDFLWKTCVILQGADGRASSIYWSVIHSTVSTFTCYSMLVRRIKDEKSQHFNASAFTNGSETADQYRPYIYLWHRYVQNIKCRKYRLPYLRMFFSLVCDRRTTNLNPFSLSSSCNIVFGSVCSVADADLTVS